MCSIAGMFVVRPLNATRATTAHAQMVEILNRASERGRTSFGMVAITYNGEERVLKREGTPDQYPGGTFPVLIQPDVAAVICNNRAEPVSEQVARKTLNDIQPFSDNSRSWWVTHNGVVANDKELAAAHKIHAPTPVDSGVLPFLIGKALSGVDPVENGGDLRALVSLLRDEIVGSFALAAVPRKGDVVYLACNWRPLYLQYDDALGVVFYASMPEYLADQNIATLLGAPAIVEVPPYTVMRLGRWHGTLDVGATSLHKASGDRKKRVLAVCSGGMDSVVTATRYVRMGHDVTLLHYQYNCRAQARELECVQAVAKDLDCNLIVVPTNIFSDIIKGNTLTDPNGRIIAEQGGRVAAKDAKEWVPARNTIMTVLAIGIAEARGMDVVALGLNLEEAGSYPDNEQALFAKLNKVVPNIVGAYKQVSIEAPLATLMKPEIVREGLELGAPLESTWSCYNGNEEPCGTCGSCYHRMQAFKTVGVHDPRFAHSTSEFWEGTRPYVRKEWG